MPRDYSTDQEIHMESGDIHEPTNTVPSYASELESALHKVANSDVSRLKGTAHEIASRRIERNRETRYLGVPTDWKKA